MVIRGTGLLLPKAAQFFKKTGLSFLKTGRSLVKCDDVIVSSVKKSASVFSETPTVSKVFEPTGVEHIKKMVVKSKENSNILLKRFVDEFTAPIKSMKNKKLAKYNISNPIAHKYYDEVGNLAKEDLFTRGGRKFKSIEYDKTGIRLKEVDISPRTGKPISLYEKIEGGFSSTTYDKNGRMREKLLECKNEWQVYSYDVKGKVTSLDVNIDPKNKHSLGEFTRFKMNFDNKKGTTTLLEKTKYDYETLLHKYNNKNVEIEKIGTLAKLGNYGETGQIKFDYVPGTEQVKSISMINGLGDVTEVIHNPSASMLNSIYLKYKVR